MNTNRLPILYQEMADLTLNKCKQCRLPLSCCSEVYCLFVMEYAEKEWGVKLQPTDHSKLPLMGEKGCTASPHLRPLCALHICERHYMIDQGFAEKYFSLRETINELEFKREW